MTPDDVLRAAVLRLAKVPACASEPAAWSLLEQASDVIDRDPTERVRLEELLRYGRVVT